MPSSRVIGKTTHRTHLALLAMACFSSYATAGELNGPHTHGVIDVVAYRTATTFEFEVLAPGQQIVGFETAPELSEQKLAVRKARELLYSPAPLFAFDEGTGCELNTKTIDVSADMLLYHKHKVSEKENSFFNKLFAKKQAKDLAEGKVTDDVHTIGDKNGHSDFRMYYFYTCKQFANVSLAGFFEHFNALETINIRKQYWDGETYITLSAKQPLLDMLQVPETVVLAPDAATESKSESTESKEDVDKTTTSDKPSDTKQATSSNEAQTLDVSKEADKKVDKKAE